jgi:hypothetical protein
VVVAETRQVQARVAEDGALGADRVPRVLPALEVGVPAGLEAVEVSMSEPVRFTCSPKCPMPAAMPCSTASFGQLVCGPVRWSWMSAAE